MAKKQLTWTNEKRKLRDLTPWEHNPRYIKDKQAERLLESFSEFGQVLPVCIGPRGEIYDGHQRRNVIGAADEYGLDYEVDVRVASRELTERERQKLTVYLHKGAAGDWDFSELANWGIEEMLVDWGFDELQFATQPDESEWGSAMGGLPTEDKAPFQQMTFTLHDSQAEEVKRAIAIASKLGDFAGSLNQNSNGNALAFICETFVTKHGDG